MSLFIFHLRDNYFSTAVDQHMLYLEKDTNNSFSALQGQLSHYNPGPIELVDWDLDRSVVIPP